MGDGSPNLSLKSRIFASVLKVCVCSFYTDVFLMLEMVESLSSGLGIKEIKRTYLERFEHFGKIT
jgi:hypothetical protein